MKTNLCWAVLLLAIFAIQLPLSGQTVLLSEDFEATATGTTPPPGWTRSQATPSYGFQFGASASISSQYYFVPAHSQFASSNDDRHDDQTQLKNDASEDRLITPPLDFTPYAGTGVEIILDVHSPNQYGSNGSLEVSTDSGMTWSVVAGFPSSSSWATLTFSLNSYTSFSHVLLAVRHNDGGEWASGVSVDNVVVRSLPSLDVELASLSMGDYQQAGLQRIQGVLLNRGGNTINSVDIIYSVDGGAPQTYNLTGLNLASGGAYNFTHNQTTTVGIGLHNVEVYVANPNGMGVDDIPANDTMRQRISALSTIPVKNVVLQDFTGAWCQFCPDGTVVMNNLLAVNSRVIGVATHEGDDMEIPDGATMMNDIEVGSFPSGAVDLVRFDDESELAISRTRWVAKSTERESHIVPVSVSILDQQYDPLTRTMTVVVGADFVGDPVEVSPPDLRLNLWVIEDSVTGVGRGYNQVNAYNNQQGHPYFGKGNPIVGFVHDHTLRHMAGGPWGSPQSIPGPITDGYSVNKTFTYALPVSFDEKHIKLVGLVQQYDSSPFNRPILNAEETRLEIAVSVDPAQDFGTITEVYPNPFKDQARIQFQLPVRGEVSIAVYDLMGKKVATLASGFMAAGAHSALWNGRTDNGEPVSNGVYSVVLSTQGYQMSQKLVLQR